MPIAINEFWKLAVASGLLSPARCQELHVAFARMKGAARQANTQSLAEWLVAEKILSRYQASQLVAGRAGPFVFGEFTVSDRIGSGRLAHFFRASSRAHPPSLVVFTAQFARDDDDLERIQQRAHAAMAVRSPHVTRVERFVPSHPPFVVVEDLAGQSLRELLTTQKCAPETAYRIAFQAALGLVALHEQKLVHGRLWPENLWVEPSGALKIMQFPLVADAAGTGLLELPAIEYLAPERFDPRIAADVRSDIYSLGCTLYELLAGRVPFPGGTVQQKMRRHQSEVAQRLDHLVPGVPEEVADLVAEMIDKEPVPRCQTASHVAHLLAPFASGSSPRQAKPPQQETRKLTPGYGAWQAPTWQSPPLQAQGAAPRGRRPADEARRAPKPVVAGPTQPQAEKNARGADTTAKATPAEAVEERIVITSSPSSTIPKPAQGRSASAMLIGTTVAGVLVVSTIVAGLVMSRRQIGGAAPQTAAPGDSAPEPSNASQDAAASDVARPRHPDETETQEVLIEDDGQTLWASPTAGTPLVLDYLPPGAQMIMVLRPAEIMASAEGSKLLDALGPAGEKVSKQLRSTLGVEWSQIEQLSIAFFLDESGSPQTAFTMRLAKALPEAALVAAWGNPTPAVRGSKKFFAGARWAYYLSAEPTGPRVAIAPPAAMNEIIDLDGRPPLAKGIERLLPGSDSARHVNLVLPSSTLFTGGKDLLAGNLDKLGDPLWHFFDEDVDAVLLSAHVGEQLFLELRAAGRPGRQPIEMAALLQGRLNRVPQRVAAYVAVQTKSYDQPIVERFPQMLRLLCEYTRAGSENRQAVLRCYLPPAAAHNLLLAGRLTLAEDPVLAP